MAVLQSTNVVGALCVNGVAVGGGGKDYKYCCITASANWTPTSDFVDGDGRLDLHLIGAGGGSGGLSAAGTGGRPQGTYSFRCRCNTVTGGTGEASEVKALVYNVTSTNACCVVIGAAGTTGSVTVGGTNFQQYTASSTVVASSAGGHSCFGNATTGVTASGGSGGESYLNISYIRNQGQNQGYDYQIICPGGTTCGPGGGGRTFMGAVDSTTLNCNVNRFFVAANSDQDQTQQKIIDRNAGVVGFGFPGVGCCDDLDSPYQLCSTNPGCAINSYVAALQPADNSSTNAPSPTSLLLGPGFGHGAPGGKVFICNNGFTTPIAASGSVGAPGIAVLRWYE